MRDAMKENEIISFKRIFYELLVLRNPSRFNKFIQGVVKRFNTLYAK